MPMKNEGYLSQKSQLLKDFDKAVARASKLLISRFGQEKGNALISESRREYETLIPKIPYIGDRSPLLIFLLPTSRYLAIYRVLKKQGRTVDDIGQLIYEMNKAELKVVPAIVRRAIGYLWFTQWYKGRVKKRAAESQQRKYPGGYVLSFVEGDGQDFDYGIDYTECAGCKFLEAQNAVELAPYMCALDKTASELMGWGLSRTMTLASGSGKCDFRFKKGGKTFVAIPELIE
jgi:hypothetical protein